MHFPNNSISIQLSPTDTQVLGREPNFIAGFYKELSGLYLYGYGNSRGVSPDNSSTNSSNRAITGWNPASILASSKPNWVGFLNYKSNNEVHFNGYLGNDNNGSRITILSRSITRTNKHFLNFPGTDENNGGISILFNYCGQMLLNDGSQTARVAEAVIVIGTHAELTRRGYGSDINKIWLVRKDQGIFTAEDITESLRVRFQMASAEEVVGCFVTDDMFMITSTPFPSTANYPYIFSDSVFADIDVSDIQKYLTVHTIDQNNYIRGTSITPINTVSLKSSMYYLTKDNFNSIILNNLNTNNIILETDSDDLKIKKLIEFYGAPSGPVVGDSSSCHFIREANNIDVFLGGTTITFPEIYPIVNINKATSPTATDLVNKFFNYLEELALTVLNLPDFYKPNIINLNDNLHLYYKNLIEQRSLNYKNFSEPYSPINSNFPSILHQQISFDVDLNTVIDTVYLPNTIKFNKIFEDLSVSELYQFKNLFLTGDVWYSYPFSTFKGYYTAQDINKRNKFTNIGRALKVVSNDGVVVKSNSGKLVYQLKLNDYLRENIPLNQSQIDTGSAILSSNSVLKKFFSNQKYENKPTLLNFEFIRKKIDGSQEPFLDYTITYSATLDALVESQIDYTNYEVLIYYPMNVLDQSKSFTILHDFYLQQEKNRLYDTIQYVTNSSIISLEFLANQYYEFNLNFNNIDQGDAVIIKMQDPYDATKYLTTTIYSEFKENTLNISSYSLKENTRQYIKTKALNYTYDIEYTYPDPNCSSAGGSSSRGDYNGDGKIDGADLAVLLANWGSHDSDYDLSGDNIVGPEDLGILLGTWGSLSSGANIDPTSTNCQDLTITSVYHVTYFDLIPESLDINTNNDVIRPDLLIFYPNQSYPVSDNNIIKTY
jgi:hypothetical protein